MRSDFQIFPGFKNDVRNAEIGRGAKEKARRNRPLIAKLASTDAVAENLNKPCILKWVVVACDQKSRRTGMFGTHRPNFPE